MSRLDDMKDWQFVAAVVAAVLLTWLLVRAAVFVVQFFDSLARMI